MPTLPSGLADQVSEAICLAIRRVREIFAERPAATLSDSIPEAIFFVVNPLA
jgi:hypothetical protein